MNAVFGACMGAVIYRLIKRDEYFHVVLAIVAFVLYLVQLAR